jgi:stage II sporulation protein B
VDKPKSEKTITIKINGKDRPFQEKKEEMKEKSWDPRQLDRQKKQEPTEFFASIQTAAGKEADDSFDWILPEETEDTEIKEYKIAAPPKSPAKNGLSTLAKKFRGRNKQGFLTSIFLAVFFAVLLGTSFGFIMLKLVFTDQAAETVAPPINETPPAENQQTPAAAADLETITTYVVQGGVFSNSEAAQQIQEANSQKGVYSQSIKMGDQTFLFLGVSGSLDEAKELGAALKSEGIDVFAKEVALEGKAIEGVNAEEKKLAELVPALYQSLSEGAGSASLGSSITPETAEKIEGHIKIVNELKDDQIQNKSLLAIREELLKASKQVETYRQSGDAASAGKIQEHLLGFLAAYQSLLQSGGQ